METIKRPLQIKGTLIQAVSYFLLSVLSTLLIKGSITAAVIIDALIISIVGSVVFTMVFVRPFRKKLKN
ncbi:MAG TPA: hypothetical protein VGN63_18925 [Flavisolibacter sp.]|nr:hypothetical protein [Flavisolibacter sp.]